MSTFEAAIAFILENEGGYSDHASDRGGATQYGITEGVFNEAKRKGRALPQHVSQITLTQAKGIYQDEYWRPSFDRIESQAIATKLLDMCVNFGVARGVEILQRAVNVLRSESISVDGVFGPQTAKAVNAVCAEDLMRSIVREQALQYARIVRANHSQAVFIVGWINRAMKVPS